MKILVLCLFAVTSVHAEQLVVPVAGEGWHLAFEGPRLFKEAMQQDAQGLQYKANAGRFNLSVFVESPDGKGGDHKACRDFYWPQASRNPMIQKQTVKHWSAPEGECVEYVLAGEREGVGAFSLANINCYCSHQGKWVDVHASVISPTDEDVQMLQKLAKSLACKEFPKAVGGEMKFALPNLGTVRLVVPAGWLVGNLTAAKEKDLPVQHTLSLFSPVDPNQHWKLTFFASETKYSTLEEIKELAARAQQPAAAGSVEGNTDLKEITLKRGVGCQATYTDASLAGKPVEIGNAKVISSGFLAPQSDILGSITIFADDAKDPEFQAAVKALETIEFAPGV